LGFLASGTYHAMTHRKRLYSLAAAVLVAAVGFFLFFSRPRELRIRGAAVAASDGTGQTVAFLAVTNRTGCDIAFFYLLNTKTGSRWSTASQQPKDASVMQSLRKGEAVQLVLTLPEESGPYRFMCGYEPLQGTESSWKIWNRLQRLRLPGQIGARYQAFIARRQPWPKLVFTDAFDRK
jgi:hypothetical protein